MQNTPDLIDYKALGLAACAALGIVRSSCPEDWEKVARAVVEAYEGQLDTIDSVEDPSAGSIRRAGLAEALLEQPAVVQEFADSLREAIKVSESAGEAIEIASIGLFIGLHAAAEQTDKNLLFHDARISELEGIVAGLITKAAA